MHRTSRMQMLLKLRGGRVNLFPLARERSKGILFREGFRDRAWLSEPRPGMGS